MDRRAFLGRLAGVAGRRDLRPASCSDRATAGAAVVAGPGPYGALGAADANGIQLPAGFTSRVIATHRPAGRRHRLHVAHRARRRRVLRRGRRRLGLRLELRGARAAPAGPAPCASTPTARSRRRTGSSPARRATAPAAPRRGAPGSRARSTRPGACLRVRSAAAGQGVAAPLLGSFTHEAAAVDPSPGTCTSPRTTRPAGSTASRPPPPGDLTAGTLFAASVSGTPVTWVPTQHHRPRPQRRHHAVQRRRGRVDLRRHALVHDQGRQPGLGARPRHPAAHGPLRRRHHRRRAAHRRRQHHRHEPSGDLFVAEDGGNMELCLITTADAQDTVAPFLRSSASPVGDHRTRVLPRRHPPLLQLAARHRRHHRRHLRGHRPVPHRPGPAAPAAGGGGAGWRSGGR